MLLEGDYRVVPATSDANASRVIKPASTTVIRSFKQNYAKKRTIKFEVGGDWLTVATGIL